MLAKDIKTGDMLWCKVNRKWTQVQVKDAFMRPAGNPLLNRHRMVFLVAHDHTGKTLPKERTAGMLHAHDPTDRFKTEHHTGITGPNAEQLEAIQDYAQYFGPKWKERLQTDWMVAGSRWPGNGRYYLLQQLRNALGPAWLHTYKLPSR